MGYQINNGVLEKFTQEKESKTVVIPEGVTEINDYVFSGKKIKQLVLPASLIKIGAHAFENNELEEIILPENLESVGDYAFYNAYEGDKIKIPNSLKRIGICAFTYNDINTITEELESGYDLLFHPELSVSKKHPYLRSDGRCVFVKNDDGSEDLVCCYKEGIIQYTVESNVRRIYDYAFYGCYRLNTFVISEGVKYLGKHVFSDRGFSEISIPKTVEDMNDLPLKCRRINNRYGGYSFYRISVEPDQDSPYYKRIRGAIYKVIQNGYELVSCQTTGWDNEYTVEKETKVIGENAFTNAKYEKIYVPSGLSEIRKGAFSNCKDLTCVTMDDAAHRDLTDGIYLPESIMVIPSEAFRHCGFNDLTISDHIEILEMDAFKDCKHIKNIRFPRNLKRFCSEKELYENNELLDETQRFLKVFTDSIFTVTFSISEENESFCSDKGVLLSKDRTKVIMCPGRLKGGKYVIPDTVNDINIAFQNAKLKSLVVGKGVTMIRGDAFFGTFGKIDEISITEFTENIGNTPDASWYGIVSEGKTHSDYEKEKSKWNANRYATTIVGKTGSYAEKWALENHYQFVGKEVSKDLLKIKKQFNYHVDDTGVVIDQYLKDEGSVKVPEFIEGKPVVKIENKCFCNKKLTKIELPASLKVIGEKVFEKCEKIKELAIPEHVEKIEDGAFSKCKVLYRIFIPDSVVKIGDPGFSEREMNYRVVIIANQNSFAFKYFEKYAESKDFHSWLYVCDPSELEASLKAEIFSYKMNKDGTLCVCDIKEENIKDICIPKSFYGRLVTSVDLWDYKGIETIEIPSTVKMIHHLPRYRQIKIDENPFYQTDGIAVFRENRKVLELSRVYSIESYTVPYGVEEISKAAFYHSDIKEIKLPDTLQKIGENAFLDCSQLERVEGSETVIEVEKKAFEGTPWLNTGEFIIFSNKLYRVNLKDDTLRIPEGITEIMSNIVPGPQRLKLKNVVFPSTLKIIHSQAFCDCALINDILLPEGVEKVGYGAFDDCVSVKSISLPSTLKSIDRCEFSFTYNDWVPVFRSGRKGINFKGQTYIGMKLKKIEVSENNPLFCVVDGALFTKDMKILVRVPCVSRGTVYTVPEGVEIIGAYAFSGNESLEKVILPDGVKTVENFAFYGSNIEEFSIPDSVTEIGSTAFDGNRWFENTSEDLVIVGKKTVFRYKGSDEVVTIPKGITKIGHAAFEKCQSITSINIPDTVTEIGYAAFEECQSLTSVTMPDSVVKIRERAFWNCQSLTCVTIPKGVTEISKDAFHNCQSLTSVTIPEGVTEIGNYAFSGCQSLTSVTIPEGVTEIGNYAFYDCQSLTSVTMPDSVTTIGSYAFYQCHSLANVTIPDSVTEIGEWAFAGCWLLKRITIPETLTEIGEWAFSGITVKTRKCKKKK